MAVLTGAMALFQQQSDLTDESSVAQEVDEMADTMPMTAGDPVATAAAGSVVLAWYQYYVKGDRQSGIFVGLWAPTLLAAASYLQQKQIVQKFKRGVSSF